MTLHALPTWLTPVAAVFLALAALSAAAVAYDVWVRGHRQQLPVMDAVWVLSALWLGPFVLPLYLRVARQGSPRWTAEHPEATRRPDRLAAAATGGLVGGAASLVGHLLGVPLVLASGLSLFGVDMYAMIAVIAVLAIALLAAFELAARKHAGRQEAQVAAAVVAAALTVVAFDIGMGGWMLGLHLNGLMPPLASASFVFLMQVGIVLGFLTGLPVVALLSRRRPAPVIA